MPFRWKTGSARATKWKPYGGCFATTSTRSLPTLQKNDIRLQVIGRQDALPPEVRRELDATVDATCDNRGMVLNLAINYGGRAEIVDAVNSILDMARLDGSIHSLKIDEDLIAASLYTASCPDPDLLIRTSGEMRISNFLLWQIAYAELYVTETLWPDFTRADLLLAVLEYQKRDRRYGGLSASKSPPADAAIDEESFSPRSASHEARPHRGGAHSHCRLRDAGREPLGFHGGGGGGGDFSAIANTMPSRPLTASARPVRWATAPAWRCSFGTATHG